MSAFYNSGMGLLRRMAGCVWFLALPGSVLGANAFLQHNLVSDLPGVADHADPALVNPWGIAATATGPFWISDNKTGIATSYDGSGVPAALPVTVLSPGGSGTSTPTGIVANSTAGFEVAPGKPATFLFATEDGTIAAWNASADALHAIIKIDHSNSGAVYKGLAIANTGGGSSLYAANFRTGTIETFSATFASVTSPGGFADPMIPAGFAPFNIQNIGNKLYVTYARQDDAKHDDVPGRGSGFVNVFDVNGALVQRLASGAPLNSPWGVALAPANFGDFGGSVLVGNFGDGAINAFNPATGNYLGAMQDAGGGVISISGLWGLQFGNDGRGGDANALYFTAGIGGPSMPLKSHGLFGSLQAAPLIAPNGVVNAASLQLGLAPYTYISIFGSSLAPTTRTWRDSDFVDGQLPTQLDGVGVMVNGTPAYVYFVSPKQINILTPNANGPGLVRVTNGALSSVVFSIQQLALSPAMFLFGSTGYVVAAHADGTPVGRAGQVPGSRPAKPNETISLYGTGFGTTIPPFPDGMVITTAYPLATQPAITIGGMPASVQFSGLTAAGLYQFNVVVPDLPDGDPAAGIQFVSLPVPSGTIPVQRIQ